MRKRVTKWLTFCFVCGEKEKEFSSDVVWKKRKEGKMINWPNELREFKEERTLVPV